MAKRKKAAAAPAKVAINLALAKKVLSVVSKGLSEGFSDAVDKDGNSAIKAGHICVEAAVSYAMGDKTVTDNPRCVAEWVRTFKISINDDTGWSSNKKRGEGLKRLAIAQLGSAYVECKRDVFWEHVSDLVLMEVKEGLIKKLQAVSGINELLDLVSDVNDETLSDYESVQNVMMGFFDCGEEEALMRACEIFVQAFVLMKIPGTKFLHLTKPPSFDKKPMGKKSKGQVTIYG